MNWTERFGGGKGGVRFLEWMRHWFCLRDEDFG